MEAPIDLVLCRWVFFATAMILFGSSLFPFYAWDRWTTTDAGDRRRAARILAALAFSAAIAWLLALSHELDAATPIFETVRTVLFETSFGPSWIARLVLAALALAGALIGQPVIVVAAAGGLLACEGWDGHAAAHGLFGQAIQALHVLCGGAWIGGLFPLAGLVTAAMREKQEARAFAPVRRFSNVALAAVAMILLTGAINVILLEPGLILTGVYARALAIKLALVAAMIAFATYNRVRLMPRMQKDDSRSTLRTLAKTTTCEQALGLAVLLAVAVLGLLDPYMANM